MFLGDPRKAGGGVGFGEGRGAGSGRIERAKEEGKPGGAVRQSPSLRQFLQGALECKDTSRVSPTPDEGVRLSKPHVRGSLATGPPPPPPMETLRHFWHPAERSLEQSWPRLC